MFRLHRILLNTGAGAADGGGGGNGETKNEQPPAQPDVAKVVEDLLKKHGNDGNAALRAVLADRDDWKGKHDAVTAKLPKEGSVVLDAETAKSYAAYQALGKPEDLKQAVYERDELQKQSAARARLDVQGEAARLHGLVPAVLSRLADQDELELVIQDGKDKLNKPIRVAHVKTTDDKGAEKLTPLVDHAAAAWKDFLPALKAQATNPQPPRGSPQAGPNTPPRPVTAPADGTPRLRRNLL